MQSSKKSGNIFTPNLLLAVVALHLTALLLFLTRVQLQISIEPGQQVLVAAFATFIAIGLAAFCLRQHSVYEAPPFLYWGLGVLSFSVLEFLHIMALSGASFLTPISDPANAALVFSTSALLSLALMLLAGLIHDVRARGAALSAWLFFIGLSGVWIVLPFLGGLKLITAAGEVTAIKTGLNLITAFSFGVCLFILLFRRSRPDKRISFWSVMALLFGLFVAIHSATWVQPGGFSYFLTQIGLVLFFALLVVAVVSEKLNLVRERGIWESVEAPTNVWGPQAALEVLDQTEDGLMVTDADGSIQFVNQVFADMVGYKKNELRGWHHSAFYDNSDFQKLSANSESGPGGKQQIELDLLRRDGRRLPALLVFRQTSDHDGQVEAVRYNVRDLRKEKMRESRLRQEITDGRRELGFFQKCMERSTEGMLVADSKRNITYVNRAFQRMVGFRSDSLLGQKTSHLFPAKHAENTDDGIWQTVLEKRVWHGEVTSRRKDGTTFLGELAVVPIDGGDGDGPKYLWIEKDITRRKLLEKSLQDQAQELTQKTNELETSKFYYESLISGMSDILIVVDNSGQCKFLNEYGKKRLGCDEDGILRQDLPPFFDDLVRLDKDYGSSIKLEIRDYESALKPKKGDPFVCSWYATPLFNRQGERIGAMAVARDISEHKKLQAELEDHARTLEHSVEERTSELGRKVAQLSQLLEIGEEIRLNVDLDVLMNKVSEAIHNLGWNKVVISLRDPETGMMRAVATSGLSADELKRAMDWGDLPFQKFEMNFKDRFRIGRSYFIPAEERSADDTLSCAIMSDLGERAADEWQSLDTLLTPIRAQNEIFGAICVDDPVDRKKPTAECVFEVEILADKAASAIENARHLKAQKENDRESKFVAEIGKLLYSSLRMEQVVDAVVRKGGTEIGEFCALLLVDSEAGVLQPAAIYHHNPRIVDLFRQGTEEQPCKVAEGILGTAFLGGKELLFSQPFPSEIGDFSKTPFAHVAQEETISSMMFVPLKARGNVIGGMIYLQLDERRKYRSDKLRLARELADRAALAIENARLFQEAGEKATELENASKLKSEFLANVSHELRTPLNAIITLSDLLTRRFGKTDFEEEHKQLSIIKRSGQNLLNLINDILDLSKIEAGRIAPVYSEIPLRDVIEEAVEHIRPLCLRKNLTLDLEISRRFPKSLYTDQDKLTKALNNVLSNAVKFTRVGGIRVKAGIADRKNFKIEVSDTGIGIPADRLGEIFKEFRQIESTDSRTFGGTGLGLAITKNVLALIDGTITVESQLGKGSAFTIVAPLKRRSDLNEEEVRELDKHSSPPKALPLRPELKDDRGNLKPNRNAILVVDDESESLYVISYYLHQNGYQVIFPEADEDAIQLAQQYEPYAVILDVIMPAKSGWEILRDLKASPVTQEIPVLMTSILSERERALEMGADEYLVKPFDPEQLLAFLSSIEKKGKRKKSLIQIANFLTKKDLPQPATRHRTGNGKTSRSRILLVDDDSDTQYALQLILEGEGYEVDFAKEGREALKKAESSKPNLILMDIMMPGMDGYETTQTLKRNDRLKDIPIVAVTAKAMKGDRERTLQAGCDDYISKPFVTEEILQIVKRWSNLP